MIEVRLPNGKVLRFPDGTSEAVVRSTAEREMDRDRVVGGMVPTESIEEATGMELDESRTFGDALRRVAMGTVASAEGHTDLKEMALRALLPKSLEDPAASLLLGSERAGIQRISGAAPGESVDEAARRQFINSGRSESPVADAIADTAGHALGIMGDLTGLVPIGRLSRAAKPAVAAAPDLAERAIRPAAEAMAPRVSSALDGVTSFLRTQFTSVGDMPPAVFNRMQDKKGSVAARVFQYENRVRDMERAAKLVGGDQAALRPQIDAALKGSETALETLPAPLRHVVKKMREDVDGLTGEIIASDLVSDELKVTLQENLGQYINRSYRAFDEASYATKVRGTQEWNRAFDFLRSDEMLESWGDDEILGYMEHLVTRHQDSWASLGGGVGKLDLSPFKHRKEIPAEIRDLMGEYKDPAVNYLRSVTRMAADIETHSMLKDIGELGRGVFLFDPPMSAADGVRPPPGHTFKIPGVSTRDPIGGLYTTPEIGKEIVGALGRNEANLYRRMNGLVKAWKTVGSVQTHARNFLSNSLKVLMQGHAPLGTNLERSAEALRTTSAAFGLGDEGARAAYEKGLRLGWLDESADAGDLESYLRAARSMRGDGTGYIKEATDALGGLAADLYKAEDNAHKLYVGFAETERLRARVPDLSEQQVDSYATWVVRNTMPTYSMVPKGVKALRDFPVVGNFVSFPAEIIRTTKNTGQLIMHELGMAPIPGLPWSPALRGVGVKRLMGTLAAFSLPAASSKLVVDRLTETSSEERTALREFMAPWDANSEFAVVSKGKGKYTTFSWSFMDPNNYLKKPFIAALREGDFGDRFELAVKETLEPFLGEEILAQHLADVARNKKAHGGPVYHDAASPADKIRASAAHIAKGVAPGTVLSGYRIGKAAAGTAAGRAVGLDKFISPSNRYGREYVLWQEMLALVGPRIQTVDVNQALGFKGYGMQRLRSDARAIYNEEARSLNSNPERLRDARKAAEESWHETQEGIMRQIKAARALGMSNADIYRTLKEYLPDDDVGMLLSGRFAPLRLEKTH